MQIAEHGHSGIYNRRYLSKHTAVDIGDIFRDRRLDDQEDRVDVRSMAISRDTQAPTTLPSDDWARITKEDKTIQELLQQRQDIHQAKARGDCATKAQMRGQLEKITKALDARRTHLKKYALRAYVKQWFENRPLSILRDTHPSITMSPKEFPRDRRHVIDALYPSDGPPSMPVAMDAILKFLKSSSESGGSQSKKRKRSLRNSTVSRKRTKSDISDSKVS